MLLMIFTFFTILIFLKLLFFALRAGWGLLKILFGILFLPLVLIGLVYIGLMYISLPILVVIALLVLFGAGSKS